MATKLLSIASILLLSLMISCAADNATEIANNKVEVKFYRLQVSEWESGLMESKFHGLLANEANLYCANHLGACGLQSLSSQFKDADIGKLENSPVDDDKDMLYEFYIKYPTAADLISTHALRYTLSADVVKSIVLQLRTNVDYISELGCEKCYITYIGEDYYGIPPSSLANKIIIPIAFVVLIVIIIVAVCLKFWEKRREKERKAGLMNVPKKKKAIEPQYTLSSQPPKSTPLPDEKMRDTKHDKQRKEKMYNDSMTTPKKQFDKTGGASNDSGLEVESYDTKHHSKHQALEPLTQDQDDKKKKRKKEKKRSKRSKVDGTQNQGYMAEDEGMEKVEMQTDL